MTKAIYFDMDGTLGNFYAVAGWLESLMAEQTKPYRVAPPRVDMRRLVRIIHKLQSEGYHIGIVSWLSKTSTPAYDARVTEAKLRWLARHMGSVQFDEIVIVPYGTPKQEVVANPFGILFDDEQQNRDNWDGVAYDVDNILDVLSALVEGD